MAYHGFRIGVRGVIRTRRKQPNDRAPGFLWQASTGRQCDPSETLGKEPIMKAGRHGLDAVECDVDFQTASRQKRQTDLGASA